MSADVLQDVREALVPILRDDVTLRGLCGRISRIAVMVSAWDTLPLPGLTYVIVDAPEVGGDGVRHQVRIQLTAWADGDDSTAMCGQLLVAAQAALSPLALLAHGLDVTMGRPTRREAPVNAQGARQLARADVDLDWVITR